MIKSPWRNPLAVLGFILISFCHDSPIRADEPGKVTSQTSVYTVNGKTLGFAAMYNLEIDGKPAAAFGLHKPPGGKTRYTYLLLFKPDPKSEGGTGAGGQGKETSFDTEGKAKIDFELTAFAGGRKIELEYKLDADGKKIASESLKVEGKEFGKDGPRVFLVDLANPKAAPVPIKVTLEAVPDFADKEETWGKPILAAVKELQEKSKEAKAFFAGEKK